MVGPVKRDDRELVPDCSDAWRPVTTAPLLGVTCFALAAHWFGNRCERWLPLLDGPNLLFHEFGQPFFGRSALVSHMRGSVSGSCKGRPPCDCFAAANSGR
jgi:hypothetical protein